MASQDELNEAAGRVARDYESMLYEAEWIIWREDDPPDDYEIWNAHVKAFLIDARRLLDFLDPPGNRRADDVTLGALAAGFESPTKVLAEFATVRVSINKRLAHLTFDAEPERVQWPVRTLSRAIDSVMQEFVRYLQESGSPYYERFGLAMDRRGPAFWKLTGG